MSSITRRLWPHAAVLLMACTCASAADWPDFRGPRGDGISLERGINRNWNTRPPALIWKVRMSDNGYSGPSVAGNTVFIIDHVEKQDVVRAMDATTGKDRWKFAYDDAQPANYGYSFSTPTIYRGKVYTVGRLGAVHCLEARTGKLIWSRNLVTDFGGVRTTVGYAASVVADGGNVIACPGGPNGFAAALNRDTGAAVWQGGGTSAVSFITPVKAVIHGRRQYVVTGETQVLGIDAADGKQLWSYDWSNGLAINRSSPVVIGNSVFISTGSYGPGCRLLDIGRDWSVKVRWQNRALQADMNTPLLIAGLLYGTGDPDHLICLDPQTGRAKWSAKGFEKGPVISVDGLILALDGRTGALAMVEPTPSGYNELGRFTPLGGQSWTSPVVSNRRLFVRNKAELACFDLR